MLANIETVRIIGSRDDARGLAGSSAVVDEEQMQIEVASDIGQLLKTVPGVYIREEDGYGLRPNIGVRAASSGRSSKVTLLEDGVMIAPAPYSNPAAYYFPTTLRMSSVEVLKGAPMLRHGPQTTGGVVNLVSTPIPDEHSGYVMAQAGADSARDIHAHYGGTEGEFGYLLETVQRSNDGFKDIDRSSRDTGYDIEDYLLKLSYDGERHSLLAKLQYSEEVSNETYAGLTDADFSADANRRYGLSEIDQMDNQHKGASLVYGFRVNDQVTLNATGYYNEFERDWFKAGVASGLISAANNGDASAQAILDGDMDLADIGYKHNNRVYESQGVELNALIELENHRIEAGGRIHKDEMDRFQPVEFFDQVNGSLVFQRVEAPTGGNNRLEEADARSLWLVDQWAVSSDLELTLSLRYEDVESQRDQFATENRDVIASTRSNNSDEWLWGAGFTYNLDPSWQLIGGVHEGFSPLGGGATALEKPESSTNYEAGVRYYQNDAFVEAIGFYSDFSEKAELCSIATPCSNGAESGSFSLGSAMVAGLEVQAGNTFRAGNLLIPVDFTYTYTEAEIDSDNAVSGALDGDRLGDIPKHTFSVRAGIDNQQGWYNYLVGKYSDSMCVNLGCNRANDPFDETESVFVVDFVSRYSINDDATVFLKVDNIFDSQEIVARAPHGARPNKPRKAYVGIEYNF